MTNCFLGGVMFNADYKNLILSFNEYHEVSDKDMPQDGEYCLLELKNGDYTAGGWHPSGKGMFIRGTADTVESEEVARWHSLERYDLAECLEDEEINCINLGPKEEGGHSVQFQGFKTFTGRRYPKEEQFCLLIMKDGTLAAGRWEKWWGETAEFIAPLLLNII